MIDFQGQVVLVTGAGRGLGRLYALEFARRGAAVVVNDLGTTMQGLGSDTAVADGVVAEIDQLGGIAVASYRSVARPETAAEVVRTAVEGFGRLDAVVSNAGIFDTVPFDDLTVEGWRRMLESHLDGGFYLSQAAYRVMKSQHCGRFVFITSSAGIFGQPNSAHYAAAKAGLFGLSNVVAIEGAEHGILANCVLPFGSSRMVTETIGEADGISTDETSFLGAIDPGLVVPVVVYLASRACATSHHAYSACAGRFARVFVGLGQGWLAERGTAPQAEDIEAHLAEIVGTETFSVPTSIFDEVAEICSRLGITA
jgi:NAD(P)-dependent dehydrogenase (short-subunit alcohol dehydrogenase family)